jgi:hypothetical protein
MLCPTYNMVGALGEACERCAGGNFKNAVIDGCYTGGRAAASVLAAEAYFHRWPAINRDFMALGGHASTGLLIAAFKSAVLTDHTLPADEGHA